MTLVKLRVPQMIYNPSRRCEVNTVPGMYIPVPLNPKPPLMNPLPACSDDVHGME